MKIVNSEAENGEPQLQKKRGKRESLLWEIIHSIFIKGLVI